MMYSERIGFLNKGRRCVFLAPQLGFLGLEGRNQLGFLGFGLGKENGSVTTNFTDIELRDGFKME